MTHAEKFKLKKSYNPDLTVIQEIVNVKNAITKNFDFYQENSHQMSKVEVDRWYEGLKELRSYLEFLKSKV
jgi:hypothetical protein